MACCILTTVMCAPDGTPVLIVNDGQGGAPNYYLQNDPATVWSGDPNTLEACADCCDQLVDNGDCTYTLSLIHI